MPILKKTSLLLLLVFMVLLFSCRRVAVPRPKGYFRIDLPAREYVSFNRNFNQAANLPLSFEYPSYGKISFEPDAFTEPGWFNIDFHSYKARIYLTYKDIRNNLEGLMEQTYTMNVKNHITKADAITEQVISDPDRDVYGILYDLKGNTATAEPNPDSLEPVIQFFREDIIHMIETLEWKD
jgi:gliding motility-associated lipoprotein GldD